MFNKPQKQIHLVLHENWRLRGQFDQWPRGWLDPVDYWITIWREYPSAKHITLKPRPDGWRVEYDPKNTWTGGQGVADGLSFDDAVTVAGELMEWLERTEFKKSVRMFDQELQFDGAVVTKSFRGGKK